MIHAAHFVDPRRERRELASQWTELRQGIALAHKAGLYGVAALLRVELAKVLAAWRDLHPAFAAQLDPDAEPHIDDSVKYCPDCETPNQFGELCFRCQQDRRAELQPGYDDGL